jgi:hypothetical protein
MEQGVCDLTDIKMGIFNVEKILMAKLFKECHLFETGSCFAAPSHSPSCFLSLWSAGARTEGVKANRLGTRLCVCPPSHICPGVENHLFLQKWTWLCILSCDFQFPLHTSHPTSIHINVTQGSSLITPKLNISHLCECFTVKLSFTWREFLNFASFLFSLTASVKNEC